MPSSERTNRIVRSLVLIAFLIGVIAYALLVPSKSDRSVLSRLCIAAAAIGMVCCGFYLYNRATVLARRRVYVVTGRVVAAKELPPVSSEQVEAFWKKSSNRSSESDQLCSICISAVDSGDARPSACCNSVFHKDCITCYWDSLGQVRCPNCRHEPPVEAVVV